MSCFGVDPVKVFRTTGVGVTPVSVRRDPGVEETRESETNDDVLSSTGVKGSDGASRAH